MNRVVFAVLLVTGAVNLQLPLYGAIGARSGVSSGGMSTLLQGYTVALLALLLTSSGWASRQTPTLVVRLALLCASVATALVWFQPDVVGLGVARWAQGAGVALVMATSTAWLARGWGPTVAARAVGAASTLGFGGGALLTTIASLTQSGLRPWSYGLWLAALLVVLVVLPTAERGPIVQSAWPKPPPWSAALGIFAGWAVAGVVIAVVPGALHALGRSGWAGATLFVLLGSGLLAQQDARRADARQALQRGAIALVVGTTVLVVAVLSGSVALLLIGAALAGTATHGWLYVGGLARSLEEAPDGSSTNGFFIAAYVGFGGPAVLLGMGLDRWGEVAWLAFVGSIALAGGGLWIGERQR